MCLRIAVFVALVLTAGSSVAAQTPDSTGKRVAVAQDAAVAWLRLVDQRRYGESWDSAAGIFREAVTRSAWEAAVREGRGPFEPVGARQLLGASVQTSLPNAPAGEYVVLQYQTKVRGGKTAIETVTPTRDKDGRWRVAGYYVRPE
jgi:hypothetical protein